MYYDLTKGKISKNVLGEINFSENRAVFLMNWAKKLKQSKQEEMLEK